MSIRTELLRFDGAVERDPAIEAWFRGHQGPLRTLAREWWDQIRSCGDEVRELVHDGCPTACLGEWPFAYVNVFTAHASVGFFLGATLPDPEGLLEGSGKRMRHVKITPGFRGGEALRALIEASWRDIKCRVEQG